jgi:hypothetical protein
MLRHMSLVGKLSEFLFRLYSMNTQLHDHHEQGAKPLIEFMYSSKY